MKVAQQKQLEFAEDKIRAEVQRQINMALEKTGADPDSYVKKQGDAKILSKLEKKVQGSDEF